MDKYLALLVAIATKLGIDPATILGSAAVAPATPWWHSEGDAPTKPLPDADNETEDKRYASFGLRFDLSRGIAPSDFPHMVEICDRLGAAQSPTEAEAIIANAGNFPTDVAIYLVLTGATQGFSPFLTPSIFAPAAIQTIRDAALYAAAKWNGTGPGPGGN